MVSFEDFKKLEIKIGTVLSAEAVEGSERLVEVVADIGVRNVHVVAGFGHLIEPTSLIGKQVPIIVNIEPTKMRGVRSEGIFIALQDGKDAVLLLPERKVSAGAIVK